MKKLVPIILISGLLLSGCGVSKTPSGGKTATRTSVPWADYTQTLKKNIDDLARLKDCQSLQDQFDAADSNNAATLSRTGHNNADLMQYIDEAMQLASC